MRSTSYGQNHGRHFVTIEGTEAEVGALHKMVAGLGYVACGREGMPLFAEKYENVVPQPDPVLMQHFTPAPSTIAKYTAAARPAVKVDLSAADDSYCSIYVEHLCGYNYTPEGYAKKAALMEQMGFVCMRSPRDEKGQYWESWFLPGLWAAKGNVSGCKSVETFINKLLQFVTPGSISAVRQRVALSID